MQVLEKTFWKFVDLFYRTYIGIDITASEVRLVTTKRNRIRQWFSVPITEGLIKDGIILEPQTLGLVIDNLLTSMKLPRNRVICSITGMPFVYRVINMPYTGELIDRDAIERAARKEMSLSEIDMYLFWQETEIHTELRERDFLVFGVPRHAVQLLMETLSRARVKRYVLDVKPLALGRMASSKDVVLVNLEKDYVDIVMVVDGLVRVMHGFTPARSEGSRDGFTREILNGLGSAAKSFNRDYPKIHLSTEVPVLISGELADSTEVMSFLKENSGHPVSNVESPSITLINMPVPQFATALGLIWKISPTNVVADGVSEYKDININFFSRLSKPFAERFKPSYVLAPLALIALVALAYFSYDSNQKKKTEVDYLSIQNTNASIQLAQEQKVNNDAVAIKKQETDNLQKLQGKLDRLKSEYQYIYGSKGEYTDNMFFIMNALPEQCRFTQITMSSDGFLVTGEANSLLNVLSYTNTLETDSDFLALLKLAQPLTGTDRITFEVYVTRK